MKTEHRQELLNVLIQARTTFIAQDSPDVYSTEVRSLAAQTIKLLALAGIALLPITEECLSCPTPAMVSGHRAYTLCGLYTYLGNAIKENAPDREIFWLLQTLVGYLDYQLDHNLLHPAIVVKKAIKKATEKT